MSILRGLITLEKEGNKIFGNVGSLSLSDPRSHPGKNI